MNRIVPLAALALVVSSSVWSAQDRPEPRNSYGAIAASRENLATGYAINQTTQEEANQLATAECEKNSEGKPCKVRVHLRNSCGAIADASNGRAGYSWGSTTEKAEGEALKACEQVGRDCQIAISFCSDTRPATADTLYQ